MAVYIHLLRYLSDVKKEIAIKSFLGLVITFTYLLQAVFMAKVVELVRVGTEIASLYGPVLLVLLCILVRGIFVREFEGYSKVLAARIKGKIRMVILERVFLLGPGYLSAKRSGKVTSLMVDGIESLEAFFVSFVPQVITVMISGTMIFLYLLRLDAVGSLMLLGSMFLCIIVPFVTIPLINRTVTDYWSGYSVLTAQYIDAIQGMTTLKTLHAEGIKGQELAADAHEFYRKSIRNTAIGLSNSSVMIVLSAIISSVTVVVVALRTNSGIVPMSALTAFMFLAVECARPMMELNRYWHNSFLGLSVAKELFEFVSAEPKVQEAEDPDRSSLDQDMQEIVLQNVSFSYETGAQAVQDLSMRIPGGSTIALVGPSGSGKSTVLNLLLRFYDTSAGEISLNGVNIRDYGKEYLLKNIAVVFQDSFLFYGTVMENIRMAKPDADEEEVICAAKAANAHDFIRLLPQGYDTMIGERGMNLSGGERQRISIARAILKDVPILLLDEATSSVDMKSEKLIQDALGELMKNRTTVVVAHRLSTIQNADRIYVLNEGRLEEAGTHEELMENRQLYHTLVRNQEVLSR